MLFMVLTQNAITYSNAEELKVFKRIRDRELKKYNKEKRGFFAKWLYLPKEIYKDIPFVEKWYQDVQNSNYQQKGFGQYFDSIDSISNA